MLLDGRRFTPRELAGDLGAAGEPGPLVGLGAVRRAVTELTLPDERLLHDVKVCRSEIAHAPLAW